jgi:NAD(P)-dependent dehydrogenase (short-subunit alcohol dehydrogenase family)
MAEARHIGKVVVSMGGDRPIEPGAFVDDRLPEGTYLVTGGLGGLGLLTARWLVAHGARSIVLVGRRAPSPAAEDVIRELGLAGAEVRTRRTDVADRQAVSALLAEIGETGPPLTGVFHAAGILDDCTLLEMTPERFEVTASKVGT